MRFKYLFLREYMESNSKGTPLQNTARKRSDMLNPSELYLPHTITRRIAQVASKQHAPYTIETLLIIEACLA